MPKNCYEYYFKKYPRMIIEIKRAIMNGEDPEELKRMCRHLYCTQLEEKIATEICSVIDYVFTQINN